MSTLEDDEELEDQWNVQPKETKLCNVNYQETTTADNQMTTSFNEHMRMLSTLNEPSARVDQNKLNDGNLSDESVVSVSLVLHTFFLEKSQI